ncbi:MAG: NAD-glutamate dehydrogenase, partial [Pseudomonadota bacterium]
MADTPQRPRPSPAKFPLDSLLEQMLAEAREEYGDGLAEGRIETLATELWNWSQMVKGSAIRLRPGESNTLLLEATGADRPFLVDSLLGVCSEAGVEVRHMFHPIVDTEKQGRRSLIQIHLPDLTEAEQKLLLEEAEATLADVVAATSDYLAMRQKMLEAIERVRTNRFVPDDYRTEGADFLTWLGNEHFVFLGARDYTFATADDGSVLPREPEMVDGSNLGLLRDEERNVLNRGAEPLLLTEEIGAFLSEPEPVILAKATLSSRVHRRVPCDYIGVKHFDGHGRVIGETRFLGLYTSEAYNEPLRNIP